MATTASRSLRPGSERRTGVEGNIIGLDASGTEVVGNKSAGRPHVQGRRPDRRHRAHIPKRHFGQPGRRVPEHRRPLLNSQVYGNLIGTDITGTLDRGTARSGSGSIAPRGLSWAADSRHGNVISGNDTGVWIVGTSFRLWARETTAKCKATSSASTPTATRPLRQHQRRPGHQQPQHHRRPDRHARHAAPATSSPATQERHLRDTTTASVPRSLQATWSRATSSAWTPAALALGQWRPASAPTDAGADGRRRRTAAPAARNIISANQAGVRLSNSGSNYHTFIQGNYIGTDITGNLDRGNTAPASESAAPRAPASAAPPRRRQRHLRQSTPACYINAISHPVIDGRLQQPRAGQHHRPERRGQQRPWATPPAS